jgi:hypothetical protein
MDIATITGLITAAAGFVISYLLQKPYIRVVRMFSNGSAINPQLYKLKNAGAATAICIVLEDAYGNPIELDLNLAQRVKSVDALAPGGEIMIVVPDSNEPRAVYYENLFGLLFHTRLEDAGNRFRMTARKTWPFLDSVSRAVFSELPPHWWRRRG